MRVNAMKKVFATLLSALLIFSVAPSAFADQSSTWNLYGSSSDETAFYVASQGTVTLTTSLFPTVKFSGWSSSVFDQWYSSMCPGTEDYSPNVRFSMANYGNTRVIRANGTMDSTPFSIVRTNLNGCGQILASNTINETYNGQFVVGAIVTSQGWIDFGGGYFYEVVALGDAGL